MLTLLCKQASKIPSFYKELPREISPRAQDVVLYRVNAEDADKFNGSGAATHSYTSNKDSGSKNTTSKNEPVVENNGSTTVTFDSTDRI